MFIRAVMRSGKLRIPPMPRLVAQLKAVVSSPLPGGGTRISSPRRAGQGHGDIVSALVLGVWRARAAKRNAPMRTPRGENPVRQETYVSPYDCAGAGALRGW
jgi:hypothetical protein